MVARFGGEAMLRRNGYLRVKEAAELLGVSPENARVGSSDADGLCE